MLALVRSRGKIEMRDVPTPTEIMAKDLPLHSWLIAVFLGFSAANGLVILAGSFFLPSCDADISLVEAMDSGCRAHAALSILSIPLASTAILLAIVAFAHRHRFMKVWRVSAAAGAAGALFGCVAYPVLGFALAGSLVGAHFVSKRANFVVPQVVAGPAIVLATISALWLSVHFASIQQSG